MKLHFLCSLIFTALLAYMVTNNSLNTRMLLIVPVLVFFYLTLVLFTIDYDKENMAVWHRKEKKLLEDTYTEFVRKYYRKEKIV